MLIVKTKHASSTATKTRFEMLYITHSFSPQNRKRIGLSSFFEFLLMFLVKVSYQSTENLRIILQAQVFFYLLKFFGRFFVKSNINSLHQITPTEKKGTLKFLSFFVQELLKGKTKLGFYGLYVSHQLSEELQDFRFSIFSIPVLSVE